MPQSVELLVSYTLFPHVWPKEKTTRSDVPWADLKARIKDAATYIRKHDCPLISMADYGETIDRDHRCLRYGENVLRIYGVEVDYDGERVPIEDAAALLQAANLEAVLYTSPSHTEAKPRWRALLPLSEPNIPEKRAFYVARANGVLGGIASKESFTLSQSFYIGRVRGAPYTVLETHGRCIDNASDLEAVYHAAKGLDGAIARDPTTDAELRERFAKGNGRYEAMLKLSSRWAARGMSAEDIETSLLEMLGSGSQNADGIDLATRARPMAVSAVRKFGESRAPARPSPADDAIPTIEYEPLHGTEPEPEKPLYPRAPMDWDNLTGIPPARPWIVDHWLSHGVTLLAGAGGIGKTLLAQTIATALALGRNFLDTIKEPKRVLFWACEDDHDELWRRQLAICRFFGVGIAALTGNLIIQPRQGLGNTLFYAEYGAPKWTGLYAELCAQVKDYRAQVTFIDNVGQTFGGKENDRHHVTSFVNGMNLNGEGPHATVLLGHPSKQIDSEFSGSTAWENAVRMRWYMGMKLPDQTPEEGAQPDDPDTRYIAKRKTNYTIRDYRKLIYRDGVFVPEGVAAGPVRRYDAGQRGEIAAAVLLKALDQFAIAGVRATEGQSSPDYLPRKVRDMKLAEDCTHRELIDAMNRLRLEGKITEGVIGRYPNRTPKMGLIRTPPSAQS